MPKKKQSRVKVNRLQKSANKLSPKQQKKVKGGLLIQGSYITNTIGGAISNTIGGAISNTIGGAISNTVGSALR